MNKEWKPIAGYEGYQISSEGVIQRITSDGTKVLKAGLSKSGYVRVNLYQGQLRKCVYVHRMVLETFKPTDRIGVEATHLDKDRGNNSVDNLAWLTKKEIMELYPETLYKEGWDNPNNGKRLSKETRKKMQAAHSKDHPKYKLTDKQVGELKRKRYLGESVKALSSEYGVSTDYVYQLTTGKRRSDIAPEFTMKE